MLQNDYLMRMILQFVQFLQQALAQKHQDPRQSAKALEEQIATAVNMEPGLFFSLAPTSMVSLLQLGDFDERLAGYLVRAMALDADFLRQAELENSAQLRQAQLAALIQAFNLDIDASDLTSAAVETFVQEAAG